MLVPWRHQKWSLGSLVVAGCGWRLPNLALAMLPTDPISKLSGPRHKDSLEGHRLAAGVGCGFCVDFDRS